MASHPFMEKSNSRICRHHLIHFPGIPPSLGMSQCVVHWKRHLKPSRISRHMDELGQHLGNKRNAIAPRNQPGEQLPRTVVFGVFRDFNGDQKACVRSMRHSFRPSIISPSRSSPDDSGRKISPTL